MQMFAFDQNWWRLPARFAALAVCRAFIIEGPGRHHQKPGQREAVLDVLEVWWNIYKGQYRMRLIYAQIPGECVLMGQKFLSMQGCDDAIQQVVWMLSCLRHIKFL